MSQVKQLTGSKEFSGEGVFNIDKPLGITSHDVVYAIRRLTGIRRVGHTGTLDPLATGVLLVCVGWATRLSEYLIGQDKSYQATIRLGQETDTYDAEGVVTAESPVAVDEEAIEAALAHFRGPIVQVPPMYSAVKKDGRPLYVLARQGVEIERSARPVTIYHLEMINWHPPDLTLDVTCSSGTYIRSLAHDLGRMLGCGGHITALRRTSVGHFSIDEAVPLDELSAETCSQYLQPADSAVAHLPAFQFSQEDAGRLQLGQRLARDTDTQPDNPLFRAYDNEGQFIGIIAAEEGHWQPRKIFHSTQ